MRTKVKRSLTYFRDRVVNAYWMIREGRFRQAWDSLLTELRSRKEQAGAVVAPPTLSPVQQAGGDNPCKPTQPSSAPVIRRLRCGEISTAADPAVLRQLLESLHAEGDPPGAGR